jgi:hypothetical protein
MRLSMSVNGAAPIVASLSGPGYLSAELKMSDRPKESEHKKRGANWWIRDRRDRDRAFEVAEHRFESRRRYRITSFAGRGR